MSSRVTVNSKLTVVSSKPVRAGNHTLSAVDRGMRPHTLHIILYYNNQERWFESFDLDPLRESLSKVLTLYPTVTGRLGPGLDGEWEVKCNDAGVRVLKATVHATLHQWLQTASGSEEKLLVSWDDMPHDPSTWSPFRIQINSFQGGGVAIGVSCSHMVADLTFVFSFLKSWTEVHRHMPITHPPLVAPLSLPLPNDVSLPRHANAASPINMGTASFKFSSSIIKQCLSKLHHACPNATPFDFLAALFWTRLASLKPPKTHHSLCICTDFRSVLKPSLPIGYFGNALHFSTLSHKAEDMQLGGIVSAVHTHLEGISDEQIWCGINKAYGEELTCVCMEHLVVVGKEGEDDCSLVYAAMFGNNQKPAHVSCRVGNVEGEGLIVVMPSSEGGFSRTVMVTLPEEQLVRLTRDEPILDLDPTMLLAACLLDH
ncbi:hypothetical protein VNO78_18469 [Psophocarpus tetragonolobus]|uniref:Uncharacterized protein n=1 Tax=Psophocarpus tetragonolobus TaxID=3891 RepID=A0AAN9XM80_PSOTE